MSVLPDYTTRTLRRFLATNFSPMIGGLLFVLRQRRISSTNRAKSHWRGKTPKAATPAIDAFACNEVRLLIACLAYEVIHIARRAMARATGTGWSLSRLRERVLRAQGRDHHTNHRKTPPRSPRHRSSTAVGRMRAVSQGVGHAFSMR